MGEDNGRGGAARIAAVVKTERARAEAAGGLAMVTFGGDMISPSVLSGIDRGAHMIDLANAVGFDLAVPGNHEFDFGPEVLQERLAESNAVWLLGNVNYRDQPGFPGTESTAIIEKAGYRLGFLGLLTPDRRDLGRRRLSDLRAAGGDRRRPGGGATRGRRRLGHRADP